MDRLEEITRKQNDEIIKLQLEVRQVRNYFQEHRKDTNNQIGDVYSNIRSGKIKIESTIIID